MLRLRKLFFEGRKFPAMPSSISHGRGVNSFLSARLVVSALLLMSAMTANAQYGNLAFTVAPGGTINIQNLRRGLVLLQ